MSQLFQALITCGLILLVIIVGHIHLWRYFLVPAGLVWVHALGEYMQDNNLGPEWAQNHLHNIGSPGRLLGYIGLAFIFASVPGKNKNQFTLRAVELVMRATIIAWSLGVVGCVLFEIKEVLFFKERLIADGYSGELDVGDLLAYGVGLALVLPNHFFMQPIVLRKVKQQLNLQ